jgi:hypothetical protein
MHRPRVLPFVLFLFVLFAAPSYAVTPAQLWVNRWGGTSVDYATSTAVDGSNNLVVTGRFAGVTNLGGGNLSSVLASDDFLVKYSASGVHLWSQSFPGLGNDFATSVAVDPSGNILVTGAFDGTTNYGGTNLVSAGSNDIFLAKFNSAGVHAWSKRFGSNGGPSGNDWGAAVATDASGNVFLTGYFSGTVDFGGGGLTSGGGFDIFLAKYDADGAHLWSKRFGSVSLVDDVGSAVAVDVLGNVIVAGSFNNTVDFGGGGKTSAGLRDMFIAKFDTNGAHMWSISLGGSGSDVIGSVATRPNGDVIVAGSFSNTMTVSGNPLTSAGLRDIFLGCFDFVGAHLWSERFGGTGDDFGVVTTDATGSAFLTGSFSGAVDFGGGTLTSAGDKDAVLAKFDENGTHVWSRRVGGANADNGTSVAVDGLGRVFASGDFSGSADFDGTNMVSNAGSVDFFLMRYGQREPTISSVSDVGSDQGHLVHIGFNGSGYDEAGSTTSIAYYLVFRRDDPPPAASTVRGPLGPSSGQARADSWTVVGFAPATGASSYDLVVPTVGDSKVLLGQYYWSVFYVSAATTVPDFFDSPPDSGYSVDNLAPGVPQNVAFGSGLLSWDASSDPDFDHYTAYGSDTNSFGTATFIDDSAAPSMDVSGSPYVYYFVTATDASGNESNPGSVNTLSGVNDAPRAYVLSVSNYPNPFNPRTTIRYTVPSQGMVTITVYDASGAHVATLVDHEDRAPGAYSTSWSGKDDNANAVSSGVYFARIDHERGIRTRKMILLK